MTIRWAVVLCLAGFFSGMMAEPVAAQAPVRIHARLFKTKTKGDTIKYSNFRSAKNDVFLVTVRLYEDKLAQLPLLDDLGLPWFEVVRISASFKDPTAPSSPQDGVFQEPTSVNGELDLILGASKSLPAELGLSPAFFTTQVTRIKNNVLVAPYEASPPQVLGVAGVTAGKINPSEIYLGGELLVDEDGRWLGDTTGLIGEKGDPGAPGAD